MEERHEFIIRRMKQTGFVRASEIAKELGVTARTVRRDLELLEEAGRLKRTRGGARWIEGDEHRAGQRDLPVHTRAGQQNIEKQRIARAAVELLEPGHHVIIDAGTTTLEIARAIPLDVELTVITNAINIAAELGQRDNIELIMCGGNFRASTWSMVGPYTLSLLEGISADLAFIGVSAIGPGLEMTNSNLFEAEVKRSMIRSARDAWVVADHTKFGHMSLARFATAEDLHGLITDTEVAEEFRQTLDSSNLEVKYV